MTIHKTESNIVMAFYGMPENGDLKQLYCGLVDWYRSINQEPTLMSVKTIHFKSKHATFARADSKLRKSDFDGISSFAIYSLKPGWQVPIQDYFIEAAFSIERDFFTLAIDTCLVAGGLGSISNMAVLAIKCLQPSYGIGYQRPNWLGPVNYALGMVMGSGPGSPDRAEGLTISRWGDLGRDRRVFNDGLLRDVYPWNFLNASQLSAKIGKQRLDKWIKADKGRGELSSITESITLWSLTDTEIEQVRPVLWNAGIIFDWKKFITAK